MFCNLDELMTSLLCYFLHDIIDQFCNTCDKKYYYIPYHFHSMRQNVR